MLIITHCGSGGRGGKAAEHLCDAGFEAYNGGGPAHIAAVDSAAPHTDSWFEGYAWRVVGASTPCGVVHLGWLYSDGSTEFLALIARPATEGEAVWSVGNPAHAALAALLVASAGRT